MKTVLLAIVLLSLAASRRHRKNPYEQFDHSDFIVTDDHLDHRCLLKSAAKHAVGALEAQIGVSAKIQDGDQCFCRYEEMDQKRQCSLVLRNPQVAYGFEVMPEEQMARKLKSTARS